MARKDPAFLMMVGMIVFGISTLLKFIVKGAYGAMFLVIGNAILRTANPTSHCYTSNASAAMIGAAGVNIALIPTVFLVRCLQIAVTPGIEKLQPNIRAMLLWQGHGVISSTLAGTIGCTILKTVGVDLGGIDVWHATCAGALGGLIIFLFSPLTTGGQKQNRPA